MQNGDILMVVGSALVAFGLISVLSGLSDRRFSRKGGMLFGAGVGMILLAWMRSGQMIGFDNWAMAAIRIISSIFGPL